MKRTTSLIALLTCVAGNNALAQEDNLSYTYFEAAYANLDIGFLDDNADFLEEIDDGGGWAIEGSFAITRNLFGFSSYSVTDSDATFVDPTNVLIRSNQDVKRFSAGAGFNLPVFEDGFSRADLVVRAAYTDVDFDDFNLGRSESDPIDDFDQAIDDLNEDSSDGFFADAMVRAQLGRPIEASLGARYTEIEDSDNVSVIGNVLWEFSENWGLNLSADVGDEISMYMLGIRYSFHTYD